MIANVICCNDSIEAVILGANDTKALKKMEKMSKKHYKDHGHYNYKNYEDYKQSVYWHLHEVEVK